MGSSGVVSCEQYIGYIRRKNTNVERKTAFPFGKAISFVLLAAFCLVWMVPLVLLVAGAVRSSGDGLREPSVLFGTAHGWTWGNFQMLFGIKPADWEGDFPSMQDFKIWLWLLNSCISAIGGTLLYLLVASLAAFAFTFLDFKFRDILFTIIIMTMVVPGTATTVANQNTVFMSGMNQSLLALIIPGLGGVYGMYLIRTFFSSIPKDLIESAKMDGYSNLQIFFKIILPLGKTVLLVQGLFGFMGGWNDLIWPQMLYGVPTENNINLWTLQVGMAYVTHKFNTVNTIGIACASGIVCIFPVLLVYLLAQKYIIEGMASAGIKR